MRLVIVLTIAVLLALPAAAQTAPAAGPPDSPEKDRAWNLSLGTGGGGFVEFVDEVAGISGTYDASHREHRIQVNARLDHEQGRMVRTGLAWVYNGWTEGYFSGGARVGAIDNSVHALLVDVTLRWLRRDHVELYSALAAGAAVWRRDGTGIASSFDRDLSSGFAFQLRYLGLSVGSERLRAFVDLGIGFEGLVVGGLTARF